MKSLGTTPNGSRIVELTSAEYAIIGELQATLAGSTFSFHEIYRDVADIDCNDAFKAVYEFTKARFEVNKMQELLDNMRRIVGVEK